MQNLLGKNRKQSILDSSANALGLFTKAIEALQKTSAEAKALVAENESKISLLEADNQLLTENALSNDAIINNINKLLGV